MAMAMGGNTRTGLEDNLYLRRGELSPGNAPLVKKMVDRASARIAELQRRVDALLDEHT